MKLHRFFVQDSLAGKDEIVIRDRELHHQLKDVLRFQVGTQLILLDNSGFEFHSIVTSFELNNLHFQIQESKKVLNVPKKDITLFQSLIKKDNFEWVLEKGTEIGVSEFVPVLSERSEKKSLNTERAKKILKEASEQSERGVIPTLGEVTKLEEIFAEQKFPLVSSLPLVAFHPQGLTWTLSVQVGLPDKIGVIVGPEGGFSEKEIALFQNHNVKIYSLGHQVLRAETAAIAISSLFLLS